MNRFRRRMKAIDKQVLSEEVYASLCRDLHADRSLVKRSQKAEQRKLAGMSSEEQIRYLSVREEERSFQWQMFTDIMGSMSAQEHHDTTLRAGIRVLRDAPMVAPGGSSIVEVMEFSLHESEQIGKLEMFLPHFMRRK